MNSRVTGSKFSVSIPSELARFVERYQKEHRLSSRSEVISIGLEKLREAELATAYREHAEEWQADRDKEFWDNAAVDDGLGGGLDADSDRDPDVGLDGGSVDGPDIAKDRG